MSVTPVSMQSTSATTIKNQEQQLLNQIKSLQNDPQGNAVQIKALQKKYNALVLQQQQQTQAAASTPQQNAKSKDTDSETKVAEAPSKPGTSAKAVKGINIEA